MRVWLICGSLLFAAGFTLGWLAGRGGGDVVVAPELGGAPREVASRGGERVESIARGAARDRPPREERRREDDDRERRRSRAESMAALEDALERGDRDALRDALRELARPGGEPLSPAAVTRLAGLLDSVEPHVVHELARALAIGGGDAGLAAVLGFAESSSGTIEARRRALDALGNLPPELAPKVAETLADFLESSAPRELRHSAARAIGEVLREGGVQKLIDILAERPGVDPELIFHAIGDVGRPRDAATLLGLLDGELGARQRTDLMRALGRVVSRGGEPAVLLDLLRETPPGVSPAMVAEAIAHASHNLSTDFLREALMNVPGDARAQERLARAMLRNGGKAGLEAILEAASSPEFDFDRRALAHALQEARLPDALPFVSELLRGGGGHEIIEPLARAMARGGTESLGELLSMLDGGGNEQTRRAIAHALEDASVADLPMDRLVELIGRESDPRVAAELSRTLSRLYPEASGSRALDLFRSASNAAERVAYADLLRRQGTPGAASEIASRLRDETNGDARWELSRVLGRLGETGVRELAGLIRDESSIEYRHRMLWGLEAAARHDGAPASDVFIDVARSDSSPDIRGQAAEILGRQGDPALVPALEELLRGERDPAVRDRIQRSLDALSGEG